MFPSMPYHTPEIIFKLAYAFSLTNRKQMDSSFSRFNSALLLSCVRLFVTPWTTARQVSLSINDSQSLPKLMSIESVMPSNHLFLCRPLLLLPSIFPSIRLFSNESALRIRWPKDWGFSFNISPSNEHPGLISFPMDWLNLLAVEGTLKSLLQHHSSKAPFQCSAFFMVQLLHSYMTAGKTIAFTRWTFAGKVMYLPFNMLSRLVITFSPRSKIALNRNYLKYYFIFSIYLSIFLNWSVNDITNNSPHGTFLTFGNFLPHWLSLVFLALCQDSCIRLQISFFMSRFWAVCLAMLFSEWSGNW